MAATDITPETENQPKKKGKLLKIILLLLIGILLAGGGFGAAYFMFGNQTNPANEIERIIERRATANVGADGDGGPKKIVKPETGSNFKTTYYEFPELLTTNLKGSRRYLQVGLGVATQYDDEVITHVDTHQLAIRSDVLAIISGYTEEEVEGKAGRDRLAEDIRDVINARLLQLEGFGGIESIFFSSFILQ